MSFVVYILHSQTHNKYYVGQTSNIEIRLSQHNKGKNKSTKYGVPWVVVYIEEYDTKSEVYQRELYIKKQKSRLYIESLIAKQK